MENKLQGNFLIGRATEPPHLQEADLKFIQNVGEPMVFLSRNPLYNGYDPAGESGNLEGNLADYNAYEETSLSGHDYIQLLSGTDAMDYYIIGEEVYGFPVRPVGVGALKGQDHALSHPDQCEDGSFAMVGEEKFKNFPAMSNPLYFPSSDSDTITQSYERMGYYFGGNEGYDDIPALESVYTSSSLQVGMTHDFGDPGQNAVWKDMKYMAELDYFEVLGQEQSPNYIHTEASGGIQEFIKKPDSTLRRATEDFLESQYEWLETEFE